MRKLLVVAALLTIAAPSHAGLGGLLKAAAKAGSHADDVGKAAAKAGSKAGTVGKAGAAGATGVGAAAYVDDGARLGDNAVGLGDDAAHLDSAAHADEAAHTKPTDGVADKAGDVAMEVAGNVPIEESNGAAPVDPKGVELGKHTGRVAKLNALEQIAKDTNDTLLLDKVQRIRAKEQERHAQRMLVINAVKR